MSGQRCVGPASAQSTQLETTAPDHPPTPTLPATATLKRPNPPTPPHIASGTRRRTEAQQFSRTTPAGAPQSPPKSVRCSGAVDEALTEECLPQSATGGEGWAARWDAMPRRSTVGTTTLFRDAITHGYTTAPYRNAIPRRYTTTLCNNTTLCQGSNPRPPDLPPVLVPLTQPAYYKQGGELPAKLPSLGSLIEVSSQSLFIDNRAAATLFNRKTPRRASAVLYTYVAIALPGPPPPCISVTQRHLGLAGVMANLPQPPPVRDQRPLRPTRVVDVCKFWNRRIWRFRFLVVREDEGLSANPGWPPRAIPAVPLVTPFASLGAGFGMSPVCSIPRDQVHDNNRGDKRREMTRGLEAHPDG